MKTFCLFTAVVCFWLGHLGVARADDTETVEVTGEAAIFDNDKAAARDKAIEDAQRKAVETAVGTMVSSETVVENFQLISDKIYSQASGYVKNYKIKSERVDDNTYVVEVKAEVSKGAIASDLDGLKNLMMRKGMPKLIVLIAEQNVGIEQPQYWWAGRGPLTSEMDVVENALIEKMREKGFSFVDTDVLSGKKGVSLPVAFLSDTQARKIASTTDAQVIIVGKAVAKDIGQTIEGSRMRSANAEITVKAINTSNGEIIAAASSQAVVPHISATTAGSQALKKAGEKLAADLIAKIAKKWAEETSGTNSIRMEVTGVKNRKQLSKLISALQNQVRGIKAVHEQRLTSGVALLDVQLAGDTRAMATELEAKDLGSDVKVEVEEVKPSAIRIKLLP